VTEKLIQIRGGISALYWLGIYFIYSCVFERFNVLVATVDCFSTYLRMQFLIIFYVSFSFLPITA